MSSDLTPISFPQGSPHTPFQSISGVFIPSSILPSTNQGTSTKRTSRQEVDGASTFLNRYKDVIDPAWFNRHAYFIRTFGEKRYHELAVLARKLGTNPTAYMAKLVHKEFNR